MRQAFLVLFFCVLGGASYAAPSQTADRSFHDPRVQESMQPGPDGGTFLRIHNSGSSPITAHVIRVLRPSHQGLPDAEHYEFFDPLYSFAPPRARAAQPIGVGTEGTFTAVPDRAAATVPKPDEVSLVAVLFADGSSAGDSSWVSVIMARRQARLAALQDAVQMLRNAQSSSEAPGQTVQQFQARLAALGGAPPHGNDPSATEQWLARRSVYSTAADNLKDGIAQGGDSVNRLTQWLLDTFASTLQALQQSRPQLVLCRINN